MLEIISAAICLAELAGWIRQIVEAERDLFMTFG